VALKIPAAIFFAFFPITVTQSLQKSTPDFNKYRLVHQEFSFCFCIFCGEKNVIA
jgi:hypothetical protein